MNECRTHAMIGAGENQSIQRKTCPSATLHTNSTRSGLEFNTGLEGKKADDQWPEPWHTPPIVRKSLLITKL
jgi:hypothetical protein